MLHHPKSGYPTVNFCKHVETLHNKAKQALMFYHLKTKCCVFSVYMQVLFKQYECLNSNFMKLLKQGLITKEHVVAHAHLNFKLKLALHYSKSLTKPFNSCAKLF